MSERLLEHYACHFGNESVEGWLGQGAITAMCLIDRWQRQEGLGGAVTEIGVHHGRTFILLALLRKAGERAVAIDVFEDQHRNVDRSGLGSRERLDANLARFAGSPTGVTVLKADSLDLGVDELTEAQGGGARLFSVDGGHTPRHAINDVRLAGAALAPGGVIVVDDFQNDAWPGVREGLDAYYADPARVTVPFAYGDNKLYACRPADRDRLRQVFAAARAEHLATGQPEELYGVEVERVWMRHPTLLMDRTADHFEARFGASDPVAWRVDEGWEQTATGLALTGAAGSLEVPIPVDHATTATFWLAGGGRREATATSGEQPPVNVSGWRGDRLEVPVSADARSLQVKISAPSGVELRRYTIE